MFTLFACSLIAAAPGPFRLADVNAARTGLSGVPVSIAPVELDGTGYFFSALEGRGATLWALTSPTDDPKLLLDLSPGGEGYGGPSEVVALPGVGIIFNYQTANEGNELWVTDGSETGTRLVADLRAGPLSSDPGRFRHIGSSVFFTADDGVHGLEPWITGGTPESTFMLGDLNPSGSSNAYGFVALDASHVLFYASDGTGMQVHVWDGASVTQVSAFAASLQPATDLLVIGTTAYMLVRDTNASNVRSFYSTDGSSTTLLTATAHTTASNLVDFSGKPHVAVDNASIVYFDGTTEQPVTTQTAASNPYVFGAMLLFSGYENGHVAIYAWDGNTKTLLKEFVDSSIHLPQWLGELGGYVYFAANEAATGRELWRTDGSADRTTIVKDFQPYSADPQDLVPFSGSLLFGALAYQQSTFDSAGGSHTLHVTDGTAVGTTTVAIPGRTDSSRPRNFSAANDGSMFFVANIGSDGVDDLGLLKSNGVPGNLDQLTKGVASFAVAGSRPLAFRASGPFPNVELWSHDGVNGGPIGSYVFDRAELVRAGDLVYFSSNEHSGTPSGTVLWRSDGTAAGTQIVHNDAASDFVPFGDKLAFFSNSELLATSGTLASTVTLYPGPAPVQVVGDRVVFFDGDTLYGADGTSAATLLGTYTGKNPRAFMRGRARGYFFVDGPTASTTELWRTDGTPAGTTLLTTLPFEGAWIYGVSNGNNVDYMALADLAGTGSSLYSVSGSTVMPVPGASSLVLCNFIAAGDRVLIAVSKTDACELWAADRSGAAPVTVDGKRLSVSDYFYEANDYALLAATDGESGTELWISDGSAALTRRYADISPGPAGSRPQEFHRAGNTIYLSALDDLDDREPYVLPSDGTPPVVTAQLSGTQVGGFYTTDVSVTFTTTELESQLFSTCAPVTVSSDGVTNVACRSLSLGGVTNTQVTIVRDATAPLITCPSDVVSSTGSVEFAPVVTDNVDPAPVVTADHASGSMFAEGVTTVTLTATDAAGHSASCSFAVTVTLPKAPVVMEASGEETSSGDDPSPPGDLPTTSARAGCSCGQTPALGDGLVALASALLVLRRRRSRSAS